MKYKVLYIIAISPVGEGLSGGDRIFIEFARNLLRENTPVTIITWEDGIKMCRRQGLTEQVVSFKKISIPSFIQKNFFLCYLTRIIKGIWWGLTAKLPSETCVIYSASDFWMDVFPSVILKLRRKKIFWVASWYQTAPNPFKGFAEGKREKKYRLRACAYWFMQLPVKPFIKVLADRILVNNVEEKKEFAKQNSQHKVKVVLGAVDTEKVLEWLHNHKTMSKEYDAVFQGRLHPQKGVVELIEIWGIVVNKIPNTQLAMIGDGPLRHEVEQKIKELNLEKNIKLFGYLFDGDKKYSIFSKSKLVVHPALYDSGGMASAEAMIFGIPVVGFDLKAYESYYPKGMIKVPIGNLDVFADTISRLLKNNSKREKLGRDAQEMIIMHWSWKQRTEDVFGELLA